MITIHHDPRRRKSRATLKLLAKKGTEPTINGYSKSPSIAATLDGFLGTLGMKPRQLLHKRNAPDTALGRPPENLLGILG